MDEFGVLTASYGLKPQGKSAPMASKATKQSSNSRSSTSPPLNPSHDYASFLDDHNGVFGSTHNNNKSQHFGHHDGGFDIFGGANNKTSSHVCFDSLFTGSSASNNNYVDDVFGGMPDLKTSNNYNNVSNIDLLDKIGSLQSKPATKGSDGFDDLIPGFGGSSVGSNRYRAPIKVNKPSKQTATSHDDPFLVFETNSTSDSSGSFLDSLGQMSKSNNSKGTTGSSNIPSLRPPPKPTNGLNINKVNSSVASSSIDELEEFAKGQVRSNSRVHIHGLEKQQHSVAKANKSKGAPDSGKTSQMKTVDDLESFFGMSSRSSSAPRSRATTLDQTFDGQMQNKRRSDAPQRVPSGSAAIMKKSSSTTSVDDLSFMFDFSLSSNFEEFDGEPEDRRNARLGRHQRTEERAAKAVADMKQRNLQTEMEQEERRRIAESLDADIKRWAAGKEGNMRALLSSLQYVLWPECAWQPVSLTDIITSASVKKVYRKATLCIHPDKVQQKGATLEQRYTAEKVFDILKEAWKKFNAEELS